jgi:hypothetical protein
VGIQWKRAAVRKDRASLEFGDLAVLLRVVDVKHGAALSPCAVEDLDAHVNVARGSLHAVLEELLVEQVLGVRTGFHARLLLSELGRRDSGPVTSGTKA